MILSWDIHSVTLPEPQYGDKHIATAPWSNETTLAGQTVQTVQPTQHRSRELELTFTTLTSAEATGLRDFLLLSLGQTITGSGSINFIGVLLSTDIEIITRDTCTYDMTVQFMASVGSFNLEKEDSTDDILLEDGGHIVLEGGHL